MPDPQLPTFLLNDLDAGGQMAASINDAVPRFAGTANPGETVFFSVDGEVFEVPVDQNGLWDFVSPELSNESHDFEVWTQNEAGDRSSTQEWETRVSATAEEGRAQRARADEWHSGGQQRWRDENERWREGLTPTPASAGGGGTGGSAPGGAGGAGAGGGGGQAGTDQGTGEYPPTPIGGPEKGNTPSG